MAVKQKYRSSNYTELMGRILANNKIKTIEHVAGLSRTNWTAAMKKITGTEKAFYIPKVKDLMPRKDLLFLKTKERGKMITRNMKDNLSGDLRRSLLAFRKTGASSFIRPTGIKAGTINPKLIVDFEERIKKTFTDYTKKDPRFKMPSNVHAIAVTETRTAINDAKMEYVRTLKEKNQEINLWKVWVHNPSLSKKPRKNHARMNGKKVPIDSMFKVYREDGIGHDLMDRPHDQFAPANQNIGCNCDVVFKAKKSG